MKPRIWLGSAVRHCVIWCMLLAVVSQTGCSIPNLEGQSCTEARDAVKEFYSWYLGTDADTRLRQRDIYDRYVSQDFPASHGQNGGPFFLSDSTPTTFKIGKCEAVNDSTVEIQVQLYWRSDNRTDQREIYAETIKNNDKWLINKIHSR